MIGKTIGNYVITSELAEGGMGAVYRGKHRTLPREVVIKSILLSGFSSGTHELLKARFLREACIQSQLDHPNIVRIYEFFAAQDNYYLVMEYVAGMSLADLLKRQGRLSPPQAIQLFKQALAGMDYAHKFTYLDEANATHTGIVHRDIKPGNMLLDGQARLRITDFGIVKVGSESGLTQSGFNPGTVAYMSPEQLRGLALDARSDIYSLGVTFYEMLAGQLPFPSSTPGSDYETRKGHIELQPPALPELHADIPAELNELVQRSLHKDPGGRYQTVAEFMEAILDYEQRTLTGERMAGNSLDTVRQTVLAATRQMRPAALTSDSTLPRAAQAHAVQERIRFNVPLEPVSFRRTTNESGNNRGKLIAGAALGLLLIGAAVPFFRSHNGQDSKVENNPAPVVQPSVNVTSTNGPTTPVITTTQPTAPAMTAQDAATPEPSPSPVPESAATATSTAGATELAQAREHESEERYREAIAAYENYLRVNPGGAQAGMVTENLKQLRQFLGVLTLADQELRQQDYESAERNFKQAITLRPDSRRAKSGYEEARTQLELARRYGPTPTPASGNQQSPPPNVQPPPPGQMPPPGGPMPPPPGRGPGPMMPRRP
ncbi:MAG: serine/threonine-protein kinase [Blastocatellia bacterium]